MYQNVKKEATYKNKLIPNVTTLRKVKLYALKALRDHAENI